MKLPYLYQLEVTSVIINITKGIDGDGEPNVVSSYEGKCRFVEVSKTVKEPDGKQIQLIGKIYVGCDIAPNVDLLEGHAIIKGRTVNIYKGVRPRNPDGSVNHTKLELI